MSKVFVRLCNQIKAMVRDNHEGVNAGTMTSSLISAPVAKGLKMMRYMIHRQCHYSVHRVADQADTSAPVGREKPTAVRAAPVVLGTVMRSKCR